VVRPHSQSTRLDVAALGLVPLRLEEFGMWDPKEHYWGEKDESIEEWAKPIIARGPRPEFEMEQVLPGADPTDPFSDPIIESNELKDAGDLSGAKKILMELCQSDLRCLDAHAHLGNFVFDSTPQDAIRHFEVGLRIGGAVPRRWFRGRAPMGSHRQPPVSAMHARLRSMSLAAGSLRCRRVRIRPDALAQSFGQPGCAFPDR